RKIDDSNAQIHNAWSLRMAKPSQTPRAMPDPWVGSSNIPTNLPVPTPKFTQHQLEEATASARHETQKEILKAVADMLGSLGIVTSTGQTLTSEVIRHRVEEMYPGTPTPETPKKVHKQPEEDICVIPDTQEPVIPDTQETRDIPDVRNTRVMKESTATPNTQTVHSGRGPKYTAKDVSELPVPISPRTQHAVAYKPPSKVKMVAQKQTTQGRRMAQNRLADTRKWVADTPQNGKVSKRASSVPKGRK
ncbi:MAG: hypothetical protein JAY74_11605, partial [Candidatus Thiodiazotropha taylori]|nr:hypothetical protein [Candidatus Thiodiazotropha taylori]